MYLELLEQFRTTRKYGEDIRPQPPAAEEEIAAAEKQMGVCFPQELRDLLSECDGDLDLLFSLQEIVGYFSCDLSARYQRGALLFFGGDGAGGLYAYRVEEGVARPGIVLWDHELDDIEALPPEGTTLLALIQNYYDICYREPLSPEPRPEQ